MTRICLIHNQINFGRGWKVEKEDVGDLAKMKSEYIIISRCPECFKAEERKINFYRVKGKKNEA